MVDDKGISHLKRGVGLYLFDNSFIDPVFDPVSRDSTPV